MLRARSISSSGLGTAKRRIAAVVIREIPLYAFVFSVEDALGRKPGFRSRPQGGAHVVATVGTVA